MVPPSSIVEPSRVWVESPGSDDEVVEAGSEVTWMPCTEAGSWVVVEDSPVVVVAAWVDGGAVLSEVKEIVVEVVAPGVVGVVPGFVVVGARAVVVVTGGLVVVVLGTVVVVVLVVEVVVGTVVVVVEVVLVVVVGGEWTTKSALFLTNSFSQVLGTPGRAPQAHTSVLPASAPEGTDTFAENSPPTPTGAVARTGPDLEPHRIDTTVPGMKSPPDAMKFVPGSPESGLSFREGEARAGNAMPITIKIAAKKATT